LIGRVVYLGLLFLFPKRCNKIRTGEKKFQALKINNNGREHGRKSTKESQDLDLERFPD
jgi:hypothetical protein